MSLLAAQQHHDTSKRYLRVQTLDDRAMPANREDAEVLVQALSRNGAWNLSRCDGCDIEQQLSSREFPLVGTVLLQQELVTDSKITVIAAQLVGASAS